MALAFLLSFGKNGLCTRTLGTLWGVSTPRTFLYSASGVVIAHAWYNFPLALAIIARAWNTISTDAEDAARLLGARAYRVFYTITLPALAGALRSSFLVIFLYCFFSLMMVLLLGGTTFTTLEVELYRSIRTQAAHPYASTLALSQTFYALLMIWGVSTEESQQAQSCVARTRPLPTQSIQGNIERIGFFALLCGILFFLHSPSFFSCSSLNNAPPCRKDRIVHPHCMAHPFFCAIVLACAAQHHMDRLLEFLRHCR